MDIKKQSPFWKCAFCTTHGRGLPLKLLKLAREGWKVKNYKKYILGRTTERERTQILSSHSAEKKGFKKTIIFLPDNF